MIITSEWPRFGVSRAPACGTIRVVTWNIGSGFGGWAEAVAPLRPDIVLVQESAPPSVVAGGISLVRCVRSRHAFALSRHRAAQRARWCLDRSAVAADGNIRKKGAGGQRPPDASVGRHAAGGSKTRQVAENYRLRIAQYEKLATLLKSTAARSEAEAILLGGDFNVPAQMPSLDPLRGFLHDAWLTAGSGWGATMPEYLPLVRIDHLWLSSQIEPISVRVVRLAGSDHRAVVADVKFRSRSAR